MRQVIFGALLTLTSLIAGACATHDPIPAASTPAPAPEPVRYTAEQFFATTSYAMAASDGIAFSRDGENILISNDASGVFNAYLLPVDGGEPVPLTRSDDDATFGASFFPADDRVLFTADQGGNELHHVYVREADGSVRDLTPGERLKASFLGWSADGRTFWVSTNERNPQMFDVYAYDADDYERRMIFENEGYSIGDISSDGQQIALVKRHSSADSDIYLARTGDESEPRLITEHDGNVAYSVHGFTPDGRSLIYATNETSEFSEAWAYDLATGEKRRAIAADWDVMYVLRSSSGRYRVHALNEDASTRLTIIDTTTGRPVQLRGVPEGNLGTVRFNRDESAIAFTVASDTSPSDIFVADLASGAARRLTNALNPAIDEDQLVEATVARFRSYDGLEIPGILYRPRKASAANPVPGIVLVHGGPGGQSRRGYSPMIQHLVNNGYAVYAINNRGSSGYGKTFYHLDDRRHGDVDLKDVVASRDWLASKDWISDRIAVMGGSYGGYMTAAALAFHPEVFDAGVNIFGVTNWVRTLESIPAWWGANRDALFDEMGDPAVDAERHRTISPLFHATRIRRPMLVVQGANDPRVLQVESDEIVAAVRANDVPVEYVLFPDEGHGFQKKQNRIEASEAYLRFLDQHLRR
ncbi:MAG: S9 family peptidase [Acidobacteria bacterium]|nr:S9 family peptidase [Acidobacteriota bacterium]